MPRLRALLALLLLAVSTSINAAGDFYCCKDQTSGRRVCGDSLPLQCRSQTYQIYDKVGNLLRQVGPPLTPEQKEAAAEEARRQRQLTDALRERRRIDQALLDTYPTATDIDLTQGKAEGDVNVSIQAAQSKLNEARQKHRKLANEAEFYKRKPMPPDLDRELRTVVHEIQLQYELIEVKKKELAQIRSKFDADRQRYFELTGQRAAR